MKPQYLQHFEREPLNVIYEDRLACIQQLSTQLYTLKQSNNRIKLDIEALDIEAGVHNEMNKALLPRIETEAQMTEQEKLSQSEKQRQLSEKLVERKKEFELLQSERAVEQELLKNVRDSVSELSNEKRKKRNQLARAKFDNGELKQANANLKQELMQANNELNQTELNANYISLKNSNQLQRELQVLRMVNSNPNEGQSYLKLQKKHLEEMIQKDKRRYKELNEYILEIYAQNETLKQQIIRFEHELQEAEMYDQKKRKQQVEQLESQIESLSRALEQAGHQAAQYQQQKTHQSKQLSEMQLKNEQLDRELDELKKSKLDNRRYLDQLETEVKQSKKSTRALKKEIELAKESERMNRLKCQEKELECKLVTSSFEQAKQNHENLVFQLALLEGQTSVQ